jgi:hypothetical protein
VTTAIHSDGSRRLMEAGDDNHFVIGRRVNDAVGKLGSHPIDQA